MQEVWNEEVMNFVKKRVAIGTLQELKEYYRKGEIYKLNKTLEWVDDTLLLDEGQKANIYRQYYEYKQEYEKK